MTEPDSTLIPSPDKYFKGLEREFKIARDRKDWFEVDRLRYSAHELIEALDRSNHYHKERLINE